MGRTSGVAGVVFLCAAGARADTGAAFVFEKARWSKSGEWTTAARVDGFGVEAGWHAIRWTVFSSERGLTADTDPARITYLLQYRGLPRVLPAKGTFKVPYRWRRVALGTVDGKPYRGGAPSFNFSKFPGDCKPKDGDGDHRDTTTHEVKDATADKHEGEIAYRCNRVGPAQGSGEHHITIGVQKANVTADHLYNAGIGAGAATKDTAGNDLALAAETPPAVGGEALSGQWLSDTGAFYIVRHVGNRVVWVQEGRPRATSVFVGTRDGNTIKGEWFDLAGRGTGSLTLRVEAGDRLVKVEATGSFQDTAWKRSMATAGLEADTERRGWDYRVFELSEPKAEVCRDTCAKEAECRAFTYVKPGVQGYRPLCALKSRVPAPTKSECCTSGVK